MTAALFIRWESLRPIMALDPSEPWPLIATEWYAYHEKVVAIVAQQWPTVRREAVYNAFIDALLELGKKPDAFDHTRGNLVTLLAGATSRLVRETHRSDSARERREEKKGKAVVAERDSAAREIVDVLGDKELAHLARAEAARTAEERRYLDLWERRIDDPVQLAQALSVEHLPEEQQQIEIKRMHKRIMKRLERIGDRLSAEEGSP